MEWSSEELAAATATKGVRGEEAGGLNTETADGSVESKEKWQASLPATCGEKEGGTRSEERRGGEREANHQREAEGAGGLGAGSCSRKFLELAEKNKASERNLVQRGRGPIFNPGSTDDIGDSQHVVESTYPHRNAISEVVVETQLTNSTRIKGNMCNAIMANIGLGSPTPTLHRGRERRYIGNDAHMKAHLINTPNSLMTLGKVIGTPRLGKAWEPRNKSPLGGNVRGP